ncbi:MAG TPA: hypothetical protein VJ801_03840, partial [Polyangia bacterium]|nr:hypothetical protein [Polyangia bacterium]
GGGACQKYAAGLQCQATCDSTGTTFTTFTCNGSGVCGLPNTQACAPYKCDSSGCKKSCGGPADCAPGYVCSSSATCVRPPEDCMNGVDDDGDGFVDCADSDCTSAGYMCVPQVPVGFTGPVEVYEGPAEIVTCDPFWTADYFGGYAAPQCNVSCSPCTCDAPTGAICGSPGFWSTTDASALCPGRAPVATPLVCATLPEKTAKMFATPGTASGGSCAAGGGTLNPQDPIWNTGHLCGADAKGGGGCDKGSVCWPKPQKAFLPQACVFASGDLSCPGTGYPFKRSYYDTKKYSDTRACDASTCGCGIPAKVSCSGELDVWSTSLCKGIGTPIALPSPCGPPPVGAVALEFSTFTPVPGSGSCTPTGPATPIGGCTPMGKATTACCTQ